MVMYTMGRAMELAHNTRLYDSPSRPYTQALLSAIPFRTHAWNAANRCNYCRVTYLHPLNPPSGCVFRTRCPKAIAECALAVPALRVITAETQICLYF